MNEEKKTGLDALVQEAAAFRAAERELHLQLEESAAKVVEWGERVCDVGEAGWSDVAQVLELILLMKPSLDWLATMKENPRTAAALDLSKGTINCGDRDVELVAAALADAVHAGGLSNPYFRKADEALGRVAARCAPARGRSPGIPKTPARLVDAVTLREPFDPVDAAREAVMSAGGSDAIIDAIEAYDRVLWSQLEERFG